jgi:DNA-binding MurR/RpiR family transcriptional regulator
LTVQRPDAALSLVRSRYAELPGALRRVAEAVLLDPPAVAGGTIVELAERSGTSVSTVSRFCRAIGFVGFAGLRLGLRSGGSASVATEPTEATTGPLARLFEQIVAEERAR